MQLKYKLGIAAVALLTAFAFGRYSVPAGSSKTTTDVKIDSTEKIDKNTHKQITIVKKPDGEQTTTIIVDTRTNSTKTQDKESKSDTSITPAKRSKINISALAGDNYKNPFSPVYGLNFNKEFLGPVTIGAWGLTNGTLGVSLGLNF